MSGGMMHGVSTGSMIMAKTRISGKTMMGVETPMPPIRINARRPKSARPKADLLSHMMGVETPIPPVAMNARRPEGRPAAGFRTVGDNSPVEMGSNPLAPPCLGEALRRGTLVKFPSDNRLFPSTDRLSGLRCDQGRSMSVSEKTDVNQPQNGVRT